MKLGGMKHEVEAKYQSEQKGDFAKARSAEAKATKAAAKLDEKIPDDPSGRTHREALEQLLGRYSDEMIRMSNEIATMKAGSEEYDALRHEMATRAMESQFIRQHLARAGNAAKAAASTTKALSGKKASESKPTKASKSEGKTKDRSPAAKAKAVRDQAEKLAREASQARKEGDTKNADFLDKQAQELQKTADDILRDHGIEPAKVSGRTSKASERESLDDLHAKARALRAKEGLPDEVRPEDLRRNEKGKLLMSPSPDYQPASKIDPFATPDARVWAKMWGPQQLGAALSDGISRSRLVAMATKVGVEHPEAIKSTAELISRITAKATNGQYAADFGIAGKRGSSSKTLNEGTTAKSSRPTKSATAPTSKIMPQFRIPGHISDPFAQVNPLVYHRLYGSDRVASAFSELSTARLRSVVDAWMRDHPDDGKPSSRTSKSALVDYLTKVVKAHDGEITSQADVNALQQSDPITGGMGRHGT